MSKPLIIVESPAKAKTIGKYLNQEFDVKASMGHIRDLPKKELGIDVENEFKPKYVIDTAKKKLIDELKKSAKESSAIYLASDHDREGEAIAWHLAQVLCKESDKKPVYRIVFNEITKKAIQEAVANPGQVDINKVDAQQARRVLDRIVGYKVSPLLWRVIDDKNLSAGRVQSVALRLICERDLAIESFVIDEYWTIESEFWKDNLPPFKAILHLFDGNKIKLENKEQSENIINELKNNKPLLSALKHSKRQIQPSPPYITSTLQQDAARILNFTGKKTMMLAQQLYEGMDIGGETIGLITYMRTDSVRIADEANQNAREVIARELGENLLFPTVRKYSNKNEAQDAHEAIRPTYPWRKPDDIKAYLNHDQFELYKIIWQRFISTQMIPLSLDSVQIDITCGKALFKASGSVIVEEGFFKYYPYINVSFGEKIDPAYHQNDWLEMKEPYGKQHFTKPPSPYTEAQLIKELESLGIGRPSTYATITNTIIERNYVSVIEKRFIPTKLGKLVNTFLVHYFDLLFNVTFTAEMENKLDLVEYGKEKWQELIKEYYNQIMDLLGKVNFKEAKQLLVEQTDIKCDKCNSPMIIKFSKKGEFLACSNYPACSNFKAFERKEDGSIEIINQEVEETGIICEKCESPMIVKKTKSGEFLGCSNYPKCKNIKNFKRDSEGHILIQEPVETNEVCPNCGGKMILRQGRYGEFMACSNYPKCKTIKSTAKEIPCPLCHEGKITSKISAKKTRFYGCSRYPDCKFTTPNKPVDMECIECKNPFLSEIYDRKTKSKYNKCPNCGKEYF